MSPSTLFPASMTPADRTLPPRAVRKPPKPMSEQEKAVRLIRLEYARRRKREKAAAAKADGLERPAALGKGGKCY
jgi:hypothetical protein